MSRLEELIEKLCPNGVEYKTIGELISDNIISTVTPSFKIKRNEYKENGITPIISQEQEYISGYCDITDSRLTNGQYVCFGDHSECIKYVNFAFVQGADGLKIMQSHASVLLPRYLFHTALNFYVKHNNYERHFKYFCNTSIPVPPLDIQNEIVKILDSFTELTAELTAELKDRKKQYEWYLDSMLNSTKIEYVKTIGELSSIVTKQTGFDYSNSIKNSLLRENTDDCLPYLQTKNFTGTKFDYNTDYYIPSYMAQKFPKLFLNEKCLLLSIVGASIGNVGYFNNQINCFLSGAICVVKPLPDTNAKYIYYYLCSATGQNKIKRRIKGGGQASLTVEDVRSMPIELPSAEEQLRIVNILDRFDALCNDISSGLPAEIEARQKQYEYYRDKLLTFKPLA